MQVQFLPLLRRDLLLAVQCLGRQEPLARYVDKPTLGRDGNEGMVDIRMVFGTHFARERLSPEGVLELPTVAVVLKSRSTVNE